MAKAHLKKYTNIIMKKKERVKPEKETFRPELTELSMSLREAKMQVLEKQRYLAVAFKKYLPIDIETIYRCIKTEKEFYGGKPFNRPLTGREIRLLRNYRKLCKEMKILAESKAARILAVHRVITNKGYKSPGITKSLPTTNQDFVDLVNWLKKTMRNPEKYKPDPLDRIYIPKKDPSLKLEDLPQPNPKDGDTFSKETKFRPISIPSLRDRCLQATYLVAYEIYSEYVADKHSYAFRKGRSPAWAAHSIAAHLRLAFKPNWVLEIDISKCFDSIDHKFIIDHTPFIPKIIISKWLKQGYILRNYENLGLIPTETGIPQGGIISPIICNTTLDGADDYIRRKLLEEILKKEITAQMTGYRQLRPKSKIFILFRFADDVIILTKSVLMAERCKQIFVEFLKPRGLKLSEAKTKITDVSGPEAEFIFVGYAFHKKFNPAINKSKWYIEPPVENVKRIQANLTKICKKKSTVKMLYYEFNSALRSWWGYYSSANAKRTFTNLSRWVFKVFYLALEERITRDKSTRIEHRRNGPKGKWKNTKIGKRYIYSIISRQYMNTLKYHRNCTMKWYLIRSEESRKKMQWLFCPSILKLIDQESQCLTKMGLNYYILEDYKTIQRINLNYSYGVTRQVLSNNFKKHGILKCVLCFDPKEVGLELHHILPVEFGGLNKASNLTLLCKTCHKIVSAAVASRNYKLCASFGENILDLDKIPPDNLKTFH